MWTRPELGDVERRLRRDDPALRLRRLLECPRLISIERKTFRGRIGRQRLHFLGTDLSPDVGRRQEEGHVQVAVLPEELLDVHCLRDALRFSDSWRRWDQDARPIWEEVERRDELVRAQRRRTRVDGFRYRASEFLDRYSWLYKQRVNVPVRIA